MDQVDDASAVVKRSSTIPQPILGTHYTMPGLSDVERLLTSFGWHIHLSTGDLGPPARWRRDPVEPDSAVVAKRCSVARLRGRHFGVGS